MDTHTRTHRHDHRLTDHVGLAQARPNYVHVIKASRVSCCTYVRSYYPEMMALSRSTELTRGAIEVVALCSVRIDAIIITYVYALQDIILKRGRKPSSFILQVLVLLAMI